MPIALVLVGVFVFIVCGFDLLLVIPRPYVCVQGIYFFCRFSVGPGHPSAYRDQLDGFRIPQGP